MKLIEKEISRSALKKILSEVFVDVLTKRKDLIEDAVIEAFEDIGLGIAMGEGRAGKYVDMKEFFQKLDTKIKGMT